jgi:sugar-phosphatase
MIKAVIFDMDGLLIDSEPFWRIAEIEAFQRLGYELTDAMLQNTMGMRNDEVVRFWINHFGIQDANYGAIEIEVLAKVQALVEAKGEILPGVIATLNFFKNQKIPLALASSSPMGIIHSVVETLKIEHFFKVMCSAEFEEFGKPHPAVFIAAANYLRVAPEDCLVFEDSIHGMIAAKAAKMKCITIPAPENFHNAKYILSDANFESLHVFLKKEQD